jgi:hypothetical protein
VSSYKATGKLVICKCLGVRAVSGRVGPYRLEQCADVDFRAVKFVIRLSQHEGCLSAIACHVVPAEYQYFWSPAEHAQQLQT